jgi:hypothetical protein
MRARLVVFVVREGKTQFLNNAPPGNAGAADRNAPVLRQAVLLETFESAINGWTSDGPGRRISVRLGGLPVASGISSTRAFVFRVGVGRQIQKLAAARHPPS